jgi:hypothetical protein
VIIDEGQIKGRGMEDRDKKVVNKFKRTSEEEKANWVFPP